MGQPVPQPYPLSPWWEKKAANIMGVERAVTVWYIHRHNILQEIRQLEQKLAPPLVVSEADPEPVLSPEESEELTHQLALARNRLHDLGPCPRPMMG